MVTLRSLLDCCIILCYQDVGLVCYVCWFSLQAYCFLMWFAISFYCWCSFKEDYILLWECCFSGTHSSRIVLSFFLLIPLSFTGLESIFTLISQLGNSNSGNSDTVVTYGLDLGLLLLRTGDYFLFRAPVCISLIVTTLRTWVICFLSWFLWGLIPPSPSFFRGLYLAICLLWTRDPVIYPLVGLKTKVPNTSDCIWSSNSLGNIIMTQLVELTAQILSSVFTYW